MSERPIRMPQLNTRITRVFISLAAWAAIALLALGASVTAYNMHGLKWRFPRVTLVIPLAALVLAAALWAKYRIELDIRSRFYRLERFTNAFGLSKGCLRGLDGRILFWDKGATRQYGFTTEEAVGAIGRELLQMEFASPAEEIEAQLRQTGQWQGEFTCRHKDGHALHMLTDWTMSRGKDGEPDVVIEISTDITAIKQAEQERARADGMLRTIVETTPGLIYAKDRAGRMMMANGAALALIGKPWPLVEGRTDLEFLDDQAQGAQIVANDQRIMARGEAEELEEAVGTASDMRIFYSIKSPLRDAGAEVIGLMGVSLDITERKQAEDRLRLMINELNHRVKNTLATVQAIASQTLRGGDQSLRRKLEARFIALAAAHDVLTRERWEGAALTDVVSDALATFGGVECGRFEVAGPPLRLVPRAALALAMGLHELATNALKYGALATPSGRVELVWTVSPEPDALFRLVWTERGGPPVLPPSTFGFGTRLIERSLAQDLGGAATVLFDEPQGVRCVVAVPLAEILAPAGGMELPRVGRPAMGITADA